MQRLITELRRLYLLQNQAYAVQDQEGDSYHPEGALSQAVLERHLLGEQTVALDLVSDAGQTRALVIDFDGAADRSGAQQWTTLCTVANALQAQLDLPAPAVSISGRKGYGLWLSLETPIPLAQAWQFLRLLHQAYFPDVEAMDCGAGGNTTSRCIAELPPFLDRVSGKWAAFINPGMGASFAEDPGLEMAPPWGAQAAFLAGLQSISGKQFEQALSRLGQLCGLTDAAMAGAPDLAGTPVKSTTTSTTATASPVAAGLLLKDASIEDVVKFLHAKNIEPTFRYLITG